MPPLGLANGQPSPLGGLLRAKNRPARNSTKTIINSAVGRPEPFDGLPKTALGRASGLVKPEPNATDERAAARSDIERIVQAIARFMASNDHTDTANSLPKTDQSRCDVAKKGKS